MDDQSVGENERMLNLLIDSIVGWSNLTDESGNEIAFSQSLDLIETVVDSLPTEVMNDLYKTILGNNMVSESDRKN